MKMKVGSKLIILFRDPDGFGAAIYNALQPNHLSSLRKSEEKFELSLEEYGIKDHKASGHLTHFVDDAALIRVSLLLLEYYEPPNLSCVVHEIMRTIRRENLSFDAIVLPFVLSASKLKCGDKYSSFNKKASSLYYQQVGPEIDFAKDIVGAAEKLPSSVQIHSEPLACFLQIVQSLNFPIAVLIGRRGIRGDQELLDEIGENLATSFALRFEKNRAQLSIAEMTKREEPWRALYG